MPHHTQKLSFAGHNGAQLAARLDTPVSPVRAWAIFAHCFTCSKDIYAAARVSRALTDHGIAVLRFDFTGLGASEGEFASTNFSSNVADLCKAVDYLRENHTAPSLMVGHSLGGAAVLAAAGDIPELNAVVTIGAPASPEHITHLFADKIGALETSGSICINLAGRNFNIEKQFLTDIEQQPQRERLAALDKPLLILHSPQDEIVDLDNARLIYEAAKHPKSFVALDGANHLLTRQNDANYAAAIIAAWASRYLPENPPQALGEGNVTVGETLAGKFLNSVQADQHWLLADEPKSVGGLDAGPAPYDFLLAGLGACTSMTLRMYADLKKIPLDQAVVSLRHSRVHAEDSEQGSGEASGKASGEASPKKLEQIERTLELHGDLTAAQRESLLKIADRCPVHRTLTGDLKISTTLVPPQ